MRRNPVRRPFRVSPRASRRNFREADDRLGVTVDLPPGSIGAGLDAARIAPRQA